MSRPPPNGLTTAPPAQPLARAEKAVPREVHELWFALARTEWRSIVFVPADEGESAADVATALAGVGKQLHELPVTLFVMANPADYALALDIVKVASTTDEPEPPSAPAIDYGEAVKMVASTAVGQRARGASGKVIVAIQPVVSEPMGLAVTQAADLVVLCMTRGRTRLASARRTIELIGRDRIAGCFLDHSG